MRPSAWLLCVQAFIIVALLASSALYVHYLDPVASGFCGLRSGCEAVRRSGVSYFFGSRFISLPGFSLLAFGALFLLSLRCAGPSTEAPPGAAGLGRLLSAPPLALFAASGIGAVLGVVLISYQAFVIGAFCWLCLVVNGAAICAAVAAFGLARTARSAARVGSPLRLGAWLVLGALAVAAPLLWSVVKPSPPVPPAITALYEPGKINVVEFVDFECPHCRRLHKLLDPMLKELGSRVNFVRQHLPLPQHPHAEVAARAALCAEAQGQGPAMADRLFAIDLSLETIRESAERLRLDPSAFDACMQSPATTAALAEHAARLPEEQFEGLPTTYVGSTKLLGVPSGAALRDALARAERPPPPAPSAPVFVVAVLVAAGVTITAGRRRSPVAHQPG